MKLKHLLAWILALVFFCGCSAPTVQTPGSSDLPTVESTPYLSDTLASAAPAAEALDEAEPKPVEALEKTSHNANKPTIGFLIPDDGSLLIRCAMHGFLRTAENLNYPARLYALSTGQNASDLLNQALNDGCSGLLIWANTPELEQAAKSASSAGIPVVVPYASTTLEATGAQAILSPDPNDFCAEALRVMCEETISRGNTEGVIAIVREPGVHQEIFDAFQAAAAASYPQFTLVEQILTGSGGTDTDAARAFIKEHADISGILSLSPGGATAWYDGEIAAEAELKKEITSTPAPVNGVKQKDPRKRTPVIMALDYTEESISLVQNGKIYALIARPFYTAAAQSTMVLDSLLHDAGVQQLTRVNAPVIRKKDIEKYAAVVSEVKEWFGM